MKIKKIYKAVAVTVFLGQLLLMPQAFYAATSTIQPQAVADNMVTTEHKLLNAYYEGPKFDGELVSSGKIETDGTFKMNDDIELGDVHSVKWYGYIKAPETGTYKFSISPNQQTKIQIGGQIILDGNKAVSFQLEKGGVYPILIESTAVKEFTLKWSINGSGMQTLSKDVFLSPQSNEKMPKGAMNGEIANEGTSSTNQPSTKVIEPQAVADNMATTEHKLLNAYYEGPKFDGELVSSGKIETDGTFKMNDDIELGDVHSVKWYGYIKAPETGTYKFSISPDQQTKIQIGGQIILDGNKAVSFQLEKGRVYPILIESTAVKEFTLKWSINGSGMQTLSKDAFLSPQSNEKMPKGAMNGEIANEGTNSVSQPSTKVIEPKAAADSMVTTEHKLYDAYYEGPKFDGELLASGKIETDGTFKMNDDIELGDVHSVKWYGYIKAPETGTYKFSISPEQQTKVQIGGQIILDGNKAVSFQLEKGRVYPILIESTAVKEFTLKWSINGSGMQTLSKDVFLSPQSNEKMPKGAMSGEITNEGTTNTVDNNVVSTSPSSKTVELLPFNSFTKNNEITIGPYGDELIVNAYANAFQASMTTVPPKLEKNKKYTLIVTARVQHPAAVQGVKLDFANKQSKEFNVTGEGYQKLELQFITDDSPTGDNGKVKISIKNTENPLIIKSIEIIDEGTTYLLDYNSFTKKGDSYLERFGGEEHILSTYVNAFQAGMATVPSMLEKNKKYTLVVIARVQNPAAVQGVKLDFANKQSKEFNVTGEDYQKLELPFTTDDNPTGGNGTVNLLLKNSHIPLIIKSIEIKA